MSLLVAGCSLDWAVREDPGAASPAEAGADTADGPVSDTSADASVADAPEPDADSGPCGDLATDLAARRAKARECQIGQGGQCSTTVDDECGCKVVVRTAGSTETTAYTDGVATFLATCGPPPAASCACPQLGLPASWACLAPGGTASCKP